MPKKITASQIAALEEICDVLNDYTNSYSMKGGGVREVQAISRCIEEYRHKYPSLIEKILERQIRKFSKDNFCVASELNPEEKSWVKQILRSAYGELDFGRIARIKAVREKIDAAVARYDAIYSPSAMADRTVQ